MKMHAFAAQLTTAGLEVVDKCAKTPEVEAAMRRISGKAKMQANNAALSAAAAAAKKDPNQTDMFG